MAFDRTSNPFAAHGRAPRALTWAFSLLLATQLATAAETPATLWSIGTADRSNAEFALAPQGYQSFQADGFFAVGQSDARTDWPYVHPGPADGWAGSRPHTFTVTFALAAAPSDGTAQLIVDFLDTHGSAPPRFRATVNGQNFETSLPRGGGDPSVYGDPSRGKPHTWTLPFPAHLLRNGPNDIGLTTLSGSWALYDAVRLETPAGTTLVPEPEGTRIARVDIPQVWHRGEGNQAIHRIGVQLRHVGSDADASVVLGDAAPVPVRLRRGVVEALVPLPAAEGTRTLSLAVRVEAREVASTNLTVAAPKLRDIWILPHSHVDVGYTHLQDEIVRIQIENLDQALRLSRESAERPEGERFKWNPEAIWAIDHYLRQATPERREAFIDAVRRGDVGIDALYGNMLTGLCRPEELVQSLAFAPRLAALTGVPVESAAICDVPGWTWGIVPAMAQAGVKYFAIGPNASARIGSIHRWANRPFYWKSQSGRDRVLCWVVDNYHHLGQLDGHVLHHVADLARSEFPYDISFLYWVGAWPEGGVDNAPPDTKLVEKVAAWNAQYAAPRVTIGLAREFFREFERRHRSRIPEHAGDLTPYWEDGAGSTARETALNRASAERLNQAETLFALHRRAVRPADRVEAAWKNVLLYSEHTWGAHNSISQPDLPFVTDQWRIKQAFALDADRQSRELLALAIESSSDDPPIAGRELDVLNTTQWSRTDLVLVPPTLAPAGWDHVTDAPGRPIPSQRLVSGELAFLAREVPPFGAARFRLHSQSAPSAAIPNAPSPPRHRLPGARLDDSRLATSTLDVHLDPVTGAIRSLRRADLDHEFVDPSAPVGLNDYRYVLGTNAVGALTNGPVRFVPLETGPLVATVRVESDAPGCRHLFREIRVVDGLDHVDIANHVDRLPVREKDSVHFGFGFHVPQGTVRMEIPWGVVRPNLDQLPGSCRNWFTVQRWVDVSNRDRGVTWAPIDAPLVQVGGMTANLMGEVRPHEWLAEAIESPAVYSWAQNNHWFTNYKADQPGITTFRYRLRPHAGGYDAAAAARLGLESTRPLLVRPARGELLRGTARLAISEPDVLVETVKTSEDGRGVIVRLYGVSGANRTVELLWAPPRPISVWSTDLSERPLKRLGRRIRVPAHAVVSLRAEFAAK